ncbi:hypothetical protein CRENBAI_009334 [Crenichthys baileyi]|uniref:Uncharacterized protein n=1 Tax=Crenichthys baileyi TaxID=28760 RepID=A0AAV9RMY8_9TELE
MNEMLLLSISTVKGNCRLRFLAWLHLQKDSALLEGVALPLVGLLVFLHQLLYPAFCTLRQAAFQNDGNNSSKMVLGYRVTFPEYHGLVVASHKSAVTLKACGHLGFNVVLFSNWPGHADTLNSRTSTGIPGTALRGSAADSSSMFGFKNSSCHRSGKARRGLERWMIPVPVTEAVVAD